DRPAEPRLGRAHGSATGRGRRPLCTGAAVDQRLQADQRYLWLRRWRSGPGANRPAPVGLPAGTGLGGADRRGRVSADHAQLPEWPEDGLRGYPAAVVRAPAAGTLAGGAERVAGRGGVSTAWRAAGGTAAAFGH